MSKSRKGRVEDKAQRRVKDRPWRNAEGGSRRSAGTERVAALEAAPGASAGGPALWPKPRDLHPKAPWRLLRELPSGPKQRGL